MDEQSTSGVRVQIPHSAFPGQTPDDIYFGNGTDVPAKLAAANAVAGEARVHANRTRCCERCGCLDVPDSSPGWPSLLWRFGPRVLGFVPACGPSRWRRSHSRGVRARLPAPPSPRRVLVRIRPSCLIITAGVRRRVGFAAESSWPGEGHLGRLESARVPMRMGLGLGQAEPRFRAGHRSWSRPDRASRPERSNRSRIP
jgi:hypothetical protein